MIPFFRKIRKKMADDNKPLKYMRYAVGEIVLVVVGILIALSINNWNEERKDRNREQEYLIRLLGDFQEHIEKFSFFKSLTTMRLAQIELLEDAVRNNKKGIENDWKIIESIEKVTWSSYLPVSRNTYVELLSSGKMSLIKSEKLREHLVKYYDEIDHWEIVLESTGHQKEFGNLTAGLLSKESLRAIENTESFDNIVALVEPEFELSKQEIIETLNKLSENEQALNLLPKLYHYHVLATKVINHLEKRCNEIITLINSELI